MNKLEDILWVLILIAAWIFIIFSKNRTVTVWACIVAVGWFIIPLLIQLKTK